MERHYGIVSIIGHFWDSLQNRLYGHSTVLQIILYLPFPLLTPSSYKVHNESTHIVSMRLCSKDDQHHQKYHLKNRAVTSIPCRLITEGDTRQEKCKCLRKSTLRDTGESSWVVNDPFLKYETHTHSLF